MPRGRRPADHLADLHGAQWHLIGHLQSNKAAKAAELFDGIDSVDSLRLAEKLNATAAKLNRRLAVLIEVNVGGEAAKSGVAPISNEMENILRAAPQLSALEVRGLMTADPYYQFWSATQRNSQEMLWESVIDTVERLQGGERATQPAQVQDRLGHGVTAFGARH